MKRLKNILEQIKDTAFRLKYKMSLGLRVILTFMMLSLIVSVGFIMAGLSMITLFIPLALIKWKHRPLEQRPLKSAMYR